MNIKTIKKISFIIGIAFLGLAIGDIINLYNMGLSLNNSIKVLIKSFSNIPFFTIEEKYLYIKVSPLIILLFLSILLVVSSLIIKKEGKKVYRFLLILHIINFLILTCVNCALLYLIIFVKINLFLFLVFTLLMLFNLIIFKVIKSFLKTDIQEKQEDKKISKIIFSMYLLLIITLLIFFNYIYCLLTISREGGLLL